MPPPSLPATSILRHAVQHRAISPAPDAVRPANLFIQLFMLLLSQGARFERERPLGLPPSSPYAPKVGLLRAKAGISRADSPRRPRRKFLTPSPSSLS